MGVITEADEKLKEALEDVDSALGHLNKIMIEECWGYDDFSEQRLKEIDDAWMKLRAIKRAFK